MSLAHCQTKNKMRAGRAPALCSLSYQGSGKRLAHHINIQGQTVCRHPIAPYNGGTRLGPRRNFRGRQQPRAVLGQGRMLKGNYKRNPFCLLIHWLLASAVLHSRFPMGIVAGLGKLPRCSGAQFHRAEACLTFQTRTQDHRLRGGGADKPGAIHIRDS